MAKAYSVSKNYKKLVGIYKALIKKQPSNPQHHATLAFIYKELGEIKKAKEHALKVLELQPGAKEEVEKFLKSLQEK